MFAKKPHPETCEKCPHRYSERGCPCWIGPEHGLVETNLTGETRIRTGCFYQICMASMIHVIRASNRPAAAVESMRNELVARQDALAEGLEAALNIIGQDTLLASIPLRPALEDKRDG